MVIETDHSIAEQTEMKMYTPDSLQSIQYTTEQQAAIDAYMREPAVEDETRHESNRLQMYGGKAFAVFNGLALEIPQFDAVERNNTKAEYLPALFNGKMIVTAIEAGDYSVNKLAVLCRITRGGAIGQWRVINLETPWLYIRELSMPVEEVNQRVDDGMMGGW